VYSAEGEVLEGWGTSGKSYIGNASDRNKLYFSPIGGGNVDAAFTPSTRLAMTTRLRVAIKD
jgi:hypothetical protein